MLGNTGVGSCWDVMLGSIRVGSCWEVLESDHANHLSRMPRVFNLARL